MYCSSQNHNYFVVSLAILFHVLILLGLLFLEWQKKVSVDFESTTGSIFVDLYRTNDLETRFKEAAREITVRRSEGPSNQTLASPVDGVAPDSIGFERVGMDEIRPAKIDGPKPHYPISSRRLKEEGEVLVRLCIDSVGEVEKAHIQKSSGYPNLDHSALSALSKWRFSATSQSLSNGLERCFRFPVRFTLEG